MLSPIDQRLAAEHHLRQIEAMVRLEPLANHADRVFSRAAADVVRLVVDGTSVNASRRLSVALFQRAFRDVASHLRHEYETLASWGYDTAVDSLIRAIPRNFFRLSSPELSRFESIDATENESIIAFIRQITLGVVVDNFTEPIARGFVRELSPTQWEGVVKSVVFPVPDRSRTTELINAPDEQGRSWRERLAVLSRKVTDVDQVSQQMAVGFSEGESQSEIRQRIKPLVSNIVSSTKRIVRTEGLRIAERMQRESWEALGDMMIGAQILAVLDQNTRQEHALRNGRVYFREPTGDQFALADIPLLPDEPNCRCWSTPVLQPPADLENDPLLVAAFRNDEGAGIPDPATYDQWFAQADVGRRILAVGRRRYETVVASLAGTREPEWSDFINPENGALLATKTVSEETTLERIIRKGRVAQLIAERRQRIADIANAGFTFQN